MPRARAQTVETVEDWKLRPQPAQEVFLESDADIAIFGGSAGGGKSYALLLECLRNCIAYYNQWGVLRQPFPGFSAVVFRRTLSDVKKSGSLWDTSFNVYGEFATPRLDTLTWVFPSKTKITFSHLEHEKNILDWQGAQIPLICFDELTHFNKKQFFYMLSRNRTTCGAPTRIRATTNPDADSWVADFISWWIDQNTGYAIESRSSKKRWFVRSGDNIIWGKAGEDEPDTVGRDDLLARFPGSRPKSVTFIRSSLTDNQILMDADPDYMANLMALDAVDRARLLDGNWKIRPAAGLYFQRHWCEIVEQIPPGTRFVRGWDIAATPKTEMNDPDWTTATKIGQTPDGRYIVVDHVAFQGAPSRVEAAMRSIAEHDGKEVRIHIPQDPAAAGKAQMENHRKLLAGFNVRFATATGDKITRFAPFSAQADPGPTGQYGRVMVLKAPWNERWFSQLEGFPDAAHDDDVDSTSEAFNGLTGKFGSGEALLALARQQLATVEQKTNQERLVEEKRKQITFAPGSVEHANAMAFDFMRREIVLMQSERP